MIEIEEKRFESNAFAAINKTVERLEEKEILEVVKNRIVKPRKFAINGIDTNQNEIVAIMDESSNGIQVNSSDSASSNMTFSFQIETDSGLVFRANSSSGNSETSDNVLVWKNFVEKKSNKVEDILLELIEKSQFDGIEERVDSARIKSILEEELNGKGINTRFFFSVKSSMDRFVIHDKNIPTQVFAESKFRVKLFPDEKISEANFLQVFFPEKNIYILQSVAWLLGLSVFLIFVIITVFYKTLRMLLMQKKITEIKNDLINNLTHEFNTPISTIALAVEAINDPQLNTNPTKLERYSSIIDLENRRLKNLVKNLLDSAAIEKGEYKLNFSESDINELINESVNELQEIINSKNAKVNLHLECQNNLLRCDEFHLKNAIKNLIENAIKYSNENPLVEIYTSDLKQGIEIAIADNGIGINKKEKKRIFETFYRVSKGNLHDVKGYGVGLSYVKSMIEKHDGKIEVQSEEGLGSIFKIYLPVNIK
ncbi:MAG: HAMP domain-containing histidine kinase [Melioribacteraceae bacterium]|nr:HAMP domain-containing histidine kinase [Melioribacteraceae bacterium]